MYNTHTHIFIYFSRFYPTKLTDNAIRLSIRPDFRVLNTESKSAPHVTYCIVNVLYIYIYVLKIKIMIIEKKKLYCSFPSPPNDPTRAGKVHRVAVEEKGYAQTKMADQVQYIYIAQRLR